MSDQQAEEMAQGCGVMLLLSVLVAVVTTILETSSKNINNPTENNQPISIEKGINIIQTDRSSNTLFNGWTTSSDGNTWNKAPESAKRDICKKISNYSTTGLDSNYFYDALEEFYNSNDQDILNTTMDTATRLMESAGYK